MDSCVEFDIECGDLDEDCVMKTDDDSSKEETDEINGKPDKKIRGIKVFSKQEQKTVKRSNQYWQKSCLQ